jgi:hypothetical protein
MSYSPPGDGRTGLDAGVQKHETKTGLPRRRSSLLNEDFRVVAGRRRSSIAYHVESFENLIDWANKSRPTAYETSSSQDGKPVEAASEEPVLSAGPNLLGENAAPPLLRIPTVGNMTSGVGTSKKKLMVLDPHASFPESLLLKATLDERNNFPEAHLPCLDGQAQSTTNSAPDQSSQKPKLLDDDATTTEATTTAAAATDMRPNMRLLLVKQKVRKSLTSHFHNTVSTFRDTLLAHSPQINPVIKRILLAQAAYANSRDESSPLPSGNNPSSRLSAGRRESKESGAISSRRDSAQPDSSRRESAAGEHISTRPHMTHIIPLSVTVAVDISKLDVTMPHIITLSEIQKEDSPDRISEGEEDCTIDDGTDSTGEQHASRMGRVRREHNERNSIDMPQHSDGKRKSLLVSGRVYPGSKVHACSLQTLPTEQRHALHTKKTAVARRTSSS